MKHRPNQYCFRTAWAASPPQGQAIYANPSRRLALIAIFASTWAGCDTTPKRLAVPEHPANCLKVKYTNASHPSSCMVAAATMAANYLDGRERFQEPDVRERIRAAGLDELRVGDVKKWFADFGLNLIALQGDLSTTPPTGVPYWLQRGYPVITVINKFGQNADYNHAVVVIGIDLPDPKDPLADRLVYYLDPASMENLESARAPVFEQWWALCQNALIVMVKDPDAPDRVTAVRPG
jgi:hypothetical protein